MINNEDLGKLSKLVEKSFVAALVAHNYATLKKDALKIENLIISPEVMDKLDIKNSKSDTSFLKTLIDLYPKDEFTCSKKVLADRLETFYKKTTLENVTEDEILEATKLWLTKQSYPYFGYLTNFIYKHEKSKTWSSRLESMILELRAEQPKITLGSSKNL
jgi:hypothetical protein